MTLGESIKKHRKVIGLSQEELGQKLFVSRQTISLWENDQTVPTIDNLMRLREIFGVPVDEILSGENIEPALEEEPKEIYSFNFDKNELRNIRQIKFKPLIIRLVIDIIFVVLLCVGEVHDFASGFFTGMFFIHGVWMLRSLLASKKDWRSAEGKICASIYTYEVFENYIMVSIRRGADIVRKSKYEFKDIEFTYVSGSWMFLRVSGREFMLRTSELKSDSVLYTFVRKKSSNNLQAVAQGNLRFISITLFVASILSIFVALSVITALDAINHLGLDNMWVFYLFTPITVGSVVFGFVLRSKGYKYKKNVIAGIIMTVLLCIYGSFTFVFAGIYTHTDEPVVKAETMIGIDIPQYKQINTQNLHGAGFSSREEVFYDSDVYFSADAVAEFEEQIKSDEKWMESIPNYLIGITSFISDTDVYDYALIYNTQEEEFNKLPEKSGEYRFISLQYNTNANKMRIIEYDINYVK